MRLQEKSLLVVVWLGLLLIGGAFAIANAAGVFSPPADGAFVDTKIESGSHLTFVLIPSAGKPKKEDIAAVAEALRAFREYADSQGYYFSTVGVGVYMRPEIGVWVLKQYGHFDELDVGRSWFNAGLKRYTKDMGDEGSLPQVIAVLDTIQVDPRDWTRIRRTELARFVGWPSLRAWEASGYPIPVKGGGREREAR